MGFLLGVYFFTPKPKTITHVTQVIWIVCFFFSLLHNLKIFVLFVDQEPIANIINREKKTYLSCKVQLLYQFCKYSRVSYVFMFLLFWYHFNKIFFPMSDDLL